MRTVTATEKYRAVQEGKMAKSVFVQQMRREYPMYISQFDNFDSSVSILKNKGMLFEAKKDNKYDTPAIKVSDESLRRGIDVELDNAGIDSAGDVSKEDYDKAKTKAEKNLDKDPKHYYNLLSGDSSKVNKHDKYVELKKNNHKDTFNDMKKATLKEDVEKELGVTNGEVSDLVKNEKHIKDKLKKAGKKYSKSYGKDKHGEKIVTFKLNEQGYFVKNILEDKDKLPDMEKFYKKDAEKRKARYEDEKKRGFHVQLKKLITPKHTFELGKEDPIQKNQVGMLKGSTKKIYKLTRIEGIEKKPGGYEITTGAIPAGAIKKADDDMTGYFVGSYDLDFFGNPQWKSISMYWDEELYGPESEFKYPSKEFPANPNDLTTYTKRNIGKEDEDDKFAPAKMAKLGEEDMTDKVKTAFKKAGIDMSKDVMLIQAVGAAFQAGTKGMKQKVISAQQLLKDLEETREINRQEEYNDRKDEFESALRDGSAEEGDSVEDWIYDGTFHTFGYYHYDNKIIRQRDMPEGYEYKLYVQFLENLHPLSGVGQSADNNYIILQKGSGVYEADKIPTEPGIPGERASNHERKMVLRKIIDILTIDGHPKTGYKVTNDDALSFIRTYRDEIFDGTIDYNSAEAIWDEYDESEANDREDMSDIDEIEHDCANHVVHEKYGHGLCIEGEHTLLEDGTVTHYDVFFKEGSKTVKNIPINELNIITSSHHGHKRRKKSNEESNVPSKFKILKKGPYYRYLPSDDVFTDLADLGPKRSLLRKDDLVVYKTAEQLLDAFKDMYVDEPERAIAWADQNSDIIKVNEDVEEQMTDQQMKDIQNYGKADKIVKPFKPGDAWSDDFDYEGMLEAGLKVRLNTPLATMEALYGSFEDVNYHSENKHLRAAIDAIAEEDKSEALDHLRNFRKAVKETLLSINEGGNPSRELDEEKRQSIVKKNVKAIIEGILTEEVINEAATNQLAKIGDDYEDFGGMKQAIIDLQNIVTDIESYYGKTKEKIQKIYDSIGEVTNEEGLKVGAFIAPAIESAFKKDLRPIISKQFHGGISLPQVKRISQADIDRGNVAEKEIYEEPKETVFTPPTVNGALMQEVNKGKHLKKKR